MDIKELPAGQPAPDNQDRIILNELPSGLFRFDGVASVPGGATYNFSDHNEFASFDDAKQAGLDWARERGVRYLFVEKPNA